MKKLFKMATLMIAVFTMSSCGLGTTGLGSNANSGASAGSALGALAGSALGGSTGSALGQTGGGVLGSLLSTLLGNATTNQQTLIGTWIYKSPEVRFESENILTQIGGTVASSKIQSTLGNQLTKIGLKEGQSSFTFNQDGSLVVTMGGKSTTGKYTYDASKHTVTMTGTLGLSTLNATVAVQGNICYLLFDSSKLLSIATNLSTSSSATSALSSLLGNYSGMKLGWSMTKK